MIERSWPSFLVLSALSQGESEQCSHQALKKPTQVVVEKGPAALKAVGYKIRMADPPWTCRYHASDSVCLKDQIAKDETSSPKIYATLAVGSQNPVPNSMPKLSWAIAPWGATHTACEVQVVDLERLVRTPNSTNAEAIHVCFIAHSYFCFITLSEIGFTVYAFIFFVWDASSSKAQRQD